MKIDFMKEVLKRKDEILKHTTELLKINSELTVYDPKSPTPFGPGIDQALRYMLDLGKKDGFNTLYASGYAGHIEYGEQDEFVGTIGHLDVVPAGEDWDYPPYGAKIVDGKIYARGAEDDKGPTMAVYYAMKIIKELELPLSKRIKLILGTDEETGWRGVRYYFEKFPEQPTYGFIPDADFPLTYAEKGIMNVKITDQVEPDILTEFKAGLRSNMVPDRAVAVLTDTSFKDSFVSYLKENNYSGKVNVKENELILSVDGVSAHGSTPELGTNAAYLLIKYFNEQQITNDFIDLINMYILDDLEGKKMGIDHHDEETGKVSINAGVIHYEAGDYQITLNIRYPNGVNSEELIKRMTSAVNSLDADLELLSHQKKLYVDPNSKLVQTLLEIYKKHSGDRDAKPMTTGGGTFARAMENSVAFGPHFPGKPSYIHQRNEYIEVDDLLMAIAIYAESLYELAK